MKRKLVILTGILTILFLANIQKTVLATTTIRIHGSNTVYPVANMAAAQFQELHPDVTFEIGGEGSGVGIADLINGQADIADASRFPKESEIQQANETGVILRVHTIAKDGIAIIVNPNNPISELTPEQITGIYNGTYTKWSELGASGITPDGIKILERDENSGTHDFFNEHFLNKHEVDSTVLYDYGQYQSTSQLFEVVATEINAIGYGGLAYVDETVKALSIKNNEGNYVAPSLDTVIDGTYPVSRSLYMITNGEPTGIVKEFIDFVLSEQGQSIVYYVGYIPIGKYDPNWIPTTEQVPIQYATIIATLTAMCMVFVILRRK